MRVIVETWQGSDIANHKHQFMTEKGILHSLSQVIAIESINPSDDQSSNIKHAALYRKGSVAACSLDICGLDKEDSGQSL